MRFRTQFPRFVASSVETGPEASRPVLDGGDVVVPNAWHVPSDSIALVGRPAVWVALALAIPRIPLGFTTLPAVNWHWEQDVGGHLFLTVCGDDARTVRVVEAGPLTGGGGALVPYRYPEDDFVRRGVVDFDPIVIPPPHGLDAATFARLVLDLQRAYDGDQRYTAIEIPFLRVGRDSNSYAVGVLLCAGVDPRAIPKRPKTFKHAEWTGYPGAEDPVHRENFGQYAGPPSPLGDGAFDVAYHDADGAVRYVVVGGEPGGRARLPDGESVALDERGRIVFDRETARRHGLPGTTTPPPAHVRDRRRFPHDPAAAGARITLCVGGVPEPLDPGTRHDGTIVARHDALGFAVMRRADGVEVVLPIAELGVEMRDPKRVDELFQVGNRLTVGLHRDRHPRLVARGAAAVGDNLRWHAFHLPRPVNWLTTVALGLPVVLGAAWWVRRTARGG